MSREEAAAKQARAWLMGTGALTLDEVNRHETPCARDILKAADAHDAANGVHRVSLDDATVERAARQVLHDEHPGVAWEDWPEGVRGAYRERVRAVLAAAVEAGQ